MRKFNKRVIIFSVPLLLLFFILELLLREIPNDYSYKRNYLDNNSNEIEVLFMGNSHVYYGVNPIYSKYNCFNGAYVSQALNCDKAIIEKYKKKWSKLNYIFLPVDYSSLFTSLENGIEKWRIKNYSIYYGINLTNVPTLQLEISYGKIGYNLMRINNYLRFNKNDRFCTHLGWGKMNKSTVSVDFNKTGKVAAKRHTVDLINEKQIAKKLELLKSIIDFSNKEKIQLVLITTPCDKSYIKHLKVRQLKIMFESIEKLKSKNMNLTYYNFMSDSSFKRKDFYDADHLNAIGAKKFTLKLEQIIDSIEMKE